MIDVRVAGDEVEALLRTAIPDTVMQGFRSVIDEEIATPPNDDRVSAYWVLYFGPGTPTDDRLVPQTFVSSINFQVTVAGGTEARCLFGVEQVREALSGVEIGSGLITETPSDVGTVRVDRAVSPPRQYLPMSYRLEP